tara:strand:- start:1021 stop:1719 length:699 start_codon:yes stop_codon:yes gene_type:complete
MATLNEIAYDLLTIVRPQISDDSDIEIEQIKFWIKNQRSLWLRNEFNKNRTIDSDLIQTVCADLEEVDASDCCDIDLDCPILRTTKKIPKTIELHHKEAILRVGPVNKKKKPFSYVDYLQVPWLASGRFNTKMIYAFLHDGYLYVYSKNSAYNSIKALTLRAVFEDPEEIANFKDCNTDQPCYSDDSEFPIKSWMIPTMKESILKSNLMIESQAEIQQADVSNNAKSDAITH